MPYVVPDKVHEPLYAIVPYHNPWRWKSREKHTIRAIKHFVDSGAVVVLVETAFNRRDFAFENSGLADTPTNCGVLGNDPRFRHMWIGLRGSSELWLKENMINLAAARLPSDWQQLCWLDSDVHFVRPNWVGECIHKLQHYSFLQMFSHARDLGPNYEMLPEDYPHAAGTGFVQAFHAGALGAAETYQYPPRVWPGLAWAATRQAFDSVGGLLDFAIWGGGDWHMAHALVEKTEGMMRTDLHKNYQKMVMQWFHRCRTQIRQNVGVMEGSILHSWHGRKTDRGYNAKHALLARVGFDPLRHLKKDYQGLYQLHDDRSPAFVQLRDLMRKIAKERNEDGTEI
jgi:hypothetical protein